MPFYNISQLPLPAGYNFNQVYKINDQQAVVGSCFGATKVRAILWQPGGFTLLNLPGQTSEAFGLNLDNVVGILDGKPFIWKKSTGVTTMLKGFDGQAPYVGKAKGINKFNQITGWIRIDFAQQPALWQTETAIPINLFAGVPFTPPSVWGEGKDINDNGFIVGFAAGNATGIGQTGFSRTMNNFKLFLDLNFTGLPNYGADALNDLLAPQIVGFIYNSTLTAYNAFIYDSLTAGLQVLGLPGEISKAADINNNGDAVGYLVIPQSPNRLNAVLWIFNGLVRVNLNDPTISNAQVKGWHLANAVSINNNGYIVGDGYLNGETRAKAWIAKPVIPFRKIPIEYMLPQALWPGQAWDRPRPKGWPFKLPFPIPPPNPFQIVGSAFNHLNNILISKNVNEITSEMSDAKTRKGIQKIASRLIDEEMRKLKVILANASKPIKKSRIASKGRK